MQPRVFLSVSLAGLFLPALLQAEEKVSYNDQVLPLLKNACLNCHNPDKRKAGLDLSTYQGALAGSDNGKIVQSGNAAASLLIKCVRQTEDPKMPPKGDKLSDADIATLEKWIQGQLLESAGGKIVAVNNNVQLAVVSLERPEGPPPLPLVDLPLEPVVHAAKGNALVALAASPWAPLVAVGGQKQVILYHTDTLQPLGILPFPEGFPAVLRFSRNGQLLLTGGGLGGKSGKVVLWKVESGERAGEIGNEFDQVLAADVSPDHAHVALGGPTKLLKIYSTKDGKLEQSIKKHTDWITAISFSPDGRYLASADRSGGIMVWEGATGKEFNSLPGHKLAVTSLAFMPGVLASGSEDGKISLWDVKEAKEIRSWAAHAGGVESVDFTPDGRLVSSGRDKVAKIWDQNGKALLTSPAFDDIVLRAVIAGDHVIAGDWGGQIRVFNVTDTKRLNDLTANPAPIAENLGAAEQRLNEAKAKLAPLQQAQGAAEAALKTAQTQVENRRKESLAALEADRQQAQKELEAITEGDKAPAQKKLEEAAQKLKTAQEAPAATADPALEKAVAEAQKAVAPAEAESSAAELSLQRWQRAQAFMEVYRARQSLAELTTRVEGLRQAAKDALAPADQAQAGATEAEKAAGEATAAAKTKADEQAKLEADSRAAQLAVTEAEKLSQSKTAQQQAAALAVEKATNDAAAGAAAFEKKKMEVAALEEAANGLAAGSAERGAADAKLAGPRGDLARLEAEVTASQTTLPATKAQAEAVGKEAAEATAGLAQARERLRTAESQRAEAVAATVAAQKSAEAATAKVAELRQKMPAVLAEAQAAKAKAEQEAASAGKELEAAKGQSEKVRAAFEARYPAQPAPPIAKS